MPQLAFLVSTIGVFYLHLHRKMSVRFQEFVEVNINVNKQNECRGYYLKVLCQRIKTL